MSDRSNGLEWVVTTEEVVITEESLSPEATAAEPAVPPIQKLLDTLGHGDNMEENDGFYCEECLQLFQDQSNLADVNIPAFILDFPMAMGVPQRALLTLPYGLMIGRSSIPGAGVGVINHGPVVSPGTHFGPYEGELTTLEASMASDFSWEICKGKDEYEYIDAAKESHSNWMRYVNWARNKDESNLLIVQCKGRILFHCCRTIDPGDELMLWPSGKLLSHFSEAWTQVWLMKLNATASNTATTSPVFVCSRCPLSFTTESFLQRHREFFHTRLDASPASAADSGDAAASPVVLSADPVEPNTCSDCGKVFKQMPHLRRHKLNVHSNKRPYCCPQCRRSFSQASGLIRHQQVHRKQGVIKETGVVTNQTTVLGETPSSEPTDVRLKHSNKRPYCCPQCGRSFSQASGLIRHQQVHRKQGLIKETGVVTNQTTVLSETPSSEPTAVTEETMDASVSETPQEVQEVMDVSDKEHTSAGAASQHDRSDSSKSCTNEETHGEREATAHEKLHPYVCSVCQRSFRQYSDLARHLRRSKGGERKDLAPDESAAAPFSCADCSLAFPSADVLQQHASEHRSEGENPDDLPAAAGDDQSHVSDSIPDPSVAESLQKRCSQRPQRLGARSKISAITKLIAPKQKAALCKQPVTDAAETTSAEPQAPAGEITKSAKDKRFSCRRCKQTHANRDELKAHNCALRQHKCGQCAMTFNTPGLLRRHERKAHASAKPHGCDRCCKVFSASDKLKRHRENDVCRKHRCTSELFSCAFCQFSFTMKSYLIKHVKRHHPMEYISKCDSGSLADELREEEVEKERLCPHCGRSFSTAKSLRSHACLHQVKVLYLCPDCGKGFTNHYSLKQHQRIHTGEKPYKCPQCDKGFSYTGQLTVHLRTHTGEKPYLCTHCGDAFRQSGDLKRHERKHTGVRPYSCTECCKSFSRPQSLKAHQMLHQGKRLFKCTQCGKSFSRNYHLRRHHQKMHS